MSLLDESTDNLGVAVTLVDGRVGRKKVEVLVSLGVPDVGTETLGKDNGERVVVVGRVFLLVFNGLLGRDMDGHDCVFICYLELL